MAQGRQPNAATEQPFWSAMGVSRQEALPEPLEKIVEFGRFDTQSDLKRLIDVLPIGVIVREGMTCRYANEYAAINMGLSSAEELIGGDLLGFITPDARATMAERAERVDAGEQAGTTRVTALRKDGAERILQLFEPRRITFDGAPAVLLIARDITHEQSLERQLLEAEQRALFARLSGGLAHEINNPLTVILYALTTLERTHSDSELLENALEATQRIARVVRDVQLLSRTHEDADACTDVTVAIDRAIHIASDELRYRATVVRRYDDPLPVRVPEGTLSRAILALLLHAITRLPTGHAKQHSVQISASSSHAAAPTTTITITDNGSPMTAQELDDDLELYSSATSATLRGGLGLAVCRQVLESVGGSITATALSPCGVRLRATLPAVAAPRPSRQVPDASPSVRTKLRVLVVDDDASVRAILRGMLIGYEVTECTGGTDALETLDASQAYDVVLSDVMMPNMAGPELYKRACAREPALRRRFVFMTGGAFSAEDRKFLERIPPSRVLKKPFQTAELISALEETANPARSD